MGAKHDTLENRLWRRVKRTPDGCWLWQGARDSYGYGHLKRGRFTAKAHRVAYEVANGDVPVAMLVCHGCDVPLCCRPSHLFIGTPKDNSDDKFRKGRFNKTEAMMAALRLGPRAPKLKCKRS